MIVDINTYGDDFIDIISVDKLNMRTNKIILKRPINAIHFIKDEIL